MDETLSPADRSSLTAEKGSVNMAIGGLILLEQGPGLSFDALCRRIEERIHLLPRFRQRLEMAPLGVSHPVWVEDENFDVAWHIRHSALPAPAGEDELASYVGREMSRRMDRSRPLWELHLIEGLAGDRVAVFPKMHHALVDGIAALGIGMILLDPTPEPMPVEPPDPGAPDGARASAGLPLPYLRKFARERISYVRGLARNAPERLLDLGAWDGVDDALRATAERAFGAVGDVKRASGMLSDLALARPNAPRLPFNRPISANRRFAIARASLADLKAASKARGATVNDAVLAVVSGMLARYLAAGGIDASELARDPVALVPVSVRGPDEAEEGGNRISIVFVDLPAGEPDPLVRVDLLHERMERIKSSSKIRAGALMVDMSGFAPPLMSSLMALAGDGGSFNLVVSNVPGPQFPIYLNRSRVLAIHPAVPLNPAKQGLNVGVFSYDGQVCFGLSSDKGIDPPVEVAAEAIEAAAAELSSAANVADTPL